MENSKSSPNAVNKTENESLPFHQRVDSTNFLLTISSIAFFGGLTSALILARRKGASIAPNEQRTQRWLKAAESKVAASQGHHLSGSMQIQALSRNRSSRTENADGNAKNESLQSSRSFNYQSNSSPPSVLMKSNLKPTGNQSKGEGEESGNEQNKKSGYSDVMKALGIATSIVALTSFVSLEVLKKSFGAESAQELTDKLRSLIPKNQTTSTSCSTSIETSSSTSTSTTSELQPTSEPILSKPLPRSEIFKRLDDLALKANGMENQTERRVSDRNENVGEDQAKKTREEWVDLLVAQLDAESKEEENEREKRKKR